MFDRVPAPQSERELLSRAEALAGLTLGELAARHALPVPTETRRGKGFAGALLEFALGADAASKPVPDFTAIGVELKTIPVDAAGQPRESTYLTTAPLRGLGGIRWESSLLRQKLARVLWVPIESVPAQALPMRRIGWPILWSPSPEEDSQLRMDWEELMSLLVTGQLAELDSRQGRWLQIRPKAADGKALTRSSDETGAPGMGLPRGFYLRPAFTRRVLGSAVAGAAAP
jgi:DNA mismatch repair protein MutH